MNKLSILIYLAGVCENIGVTLTILAVVLFFLSGVLIGVRQFLICNYFHDLRHYGAAAESCKKPSLWPSVVSVTTFLVATFIACLLPNRDTVYAIAASQVGEDVIQSPLGVKAQKAVESWLDKQIASNTSKPEATGK